jgi:hypothetical protein
MDSDRKRRQEQALIGEMIALYCRRKHRKPALCADCAGLREYAQMRSERCPYMETKTFCSNCQTHCYSPKMREKIRAVMRYAGPRIIFTHPVAAIKHAYYSRRKKNETATL